LLRQDIKAPYEVIVVDNGSTDDTAAFAKEWAGLHPFVRYAFEPRPGPSAARNTGVGLARADIVAFTDDDIRPAPEWVRSIVHAFERWPDVECVAGRILPAWPGPVPSWLTIDHWTGALALQDYGDTPRVIGLEQPLSLASANLAFRRTTLHALGGFRQDYLYAEDTELLLRLWRAGHRCRYVPELVVIAEVQPERMTKAYHRHWHRRNGEWAARMELDESFDGSGRLRDHPADAPRLFGAQGFLYRRLLVTTLQYVAAAARFRRGRAFCYEKQLWQLSSYIRTRAARRTGAQRTNAFSEVTAFSVALARRKLSWRRPSRS
jgi:cellulose synthase/poly-beta-1,6-N-acetylglucosamine synthase-like glycosyltransferase